MRHDLGTLFENLSTAGRGRTLQETPGFSDVTDACGNGHRADKRQQWIEEDPDDRWDLVDVLAREQF